MRALLGRAGRGWANNQAQPGFQLVRMASVRGMLGSARQRGPARYNPPQPAALRDQRRGSQQGLFGPESGSSDQTRPDQVASLEWTGALGSDPEAPWALPVAKALVLEP